MKIEIVDLIDATGANAENIPATAKKVAGYVTGSGGVPWTAADWAMFPNSGRVRIEQDPPAALPLHSDVLDVEQGAADPSHAPRWVESRIAAGIKWSTIYGSAGYLASVYNELIKAGFAKFVGHVDCWLADWNLNRPLAVELVGTQVHGMTCRAVQWASPTYNAGTLVPGSSMTLAQALVDLSVADAAWHPAPTARADVLWAIETPAGAAPSLHELVSADGGHTYH